MTLAEYLTAPRPPFDFRQGDCCRWVAGWVIARGSPDPMAFIRDRYDSERSALRRIREGGGLVELWTRGMIDAGVPEADEARPGDVGVILAETTDGGTEAPAICAGERWLTLGLRGIEAAPATVLKAWRV